ncbi:dihydroneopterin aldolase [Aliidiomarina celeris]|uniref:dihydroneopterin aldolase n=1 Tax=Aliidiomarina celeris TaxID=2249428 RepID=UPI001E2DC98E|nr:dihydroneopterin aldolase [Aliidiomarina celeris]
MDRVVIEGLTINATIGIFDWEQRILQPLVIDLDMAWNNAKPAQTKDIADALDYAAVSDAVVNLISAQPWGLIEDVAERVAALILQDFSVPQVRVRVAKPTAVKQATTVAVSIEREASA